MCIVSNWVNEAQDLMAVTKYDDLPNSLIPTAYSPTLHSPGVNLYATKAKVEIFKWTYKDAFIVYSECPKWLSDRKSQVM